VDRHPAILVQAFVREVTDEDGGEMSLIFFNLVVQFAVLKRPKRGDFRVQVCARVHVAAHLGHGRHEPTSFDCCTGGCDWCSLHWRV
jgi:hypothetical protein